MFKKFKKTLGYIIYCILLLVLLITYLTQQTLNYKLLQNNTIEQQIEQTTSQEEQKES